MSYSKPIAALLFFYECIRLLLLLAMLCIMLLPSGFWAQLGLLLPNNSFSGSGAFFPMIVYSSSNALFLLMALFMWRGTEEYTGSYIQLYIAGKVIAVVSFCAWMLLTRRADTGAEHGIISIVVVGISAIINVADMLSVLGAWILNNKYRKAEV